MNNMTNFERSALHNVYQSFPNSSTDIINDTLPILVSDIMERSGASEQPGIFEA